MTLEQQCRHEYVRIFQRKLKGLERRLVATKAWLPVGFKIADLSHLGDGSYCFCSKCRARLYPKRTNAERAQARLTLALSKQQQLDGELHEHGDELASEASDIHVEELVVESVELEDLDQGSVAIESDDTCQLSSEDT